VLETVFRTDDVPAEDRFDLWRELMAKTMIPMEMTSTEAHQFQARMCLLRLGEVSVWPAESRPMSFNRTPRLIRQSDPEFYHLSLPLHGTLRVSQDGREAVHGPGGMFFVSTSRPHDCDNAPARIVGVEIPRRLVPLPDERVDQLITRRLSGRDGFGALLAGFLTHLAKDATSFQPADGPRLQTILLDLLCATLTHHLDADNQLPPESRSRALRMRIRTFIRQHLHDPDLTPTAVADAHHISLSYLHRLFRAEGITVAAWIRHQRLEHARHDLADPHMRHLPAHAIARRWGFTQYAVFSRTFRTAYGLPPRDYRHHHEDADSSRGVGRE
jgi:AraC-like DNA-binding protein